MDTASAVGLNEDSDIQQRYDMTRAQMSTVKKTKAVAHRGARTHDHKIKSLALYQLR